MGPYVLLKSCEIFALLLLVRERKILIAFNLVNMKLLGLDNYGRGSMCKSNDCLIDPTL